MQSRPIGIAGNDGLARAVADRLAAGNQRVLCYAPGSSIITVAHKNIETAATPADIGFDCEIVFTFVDDSNAFRTLLLGTPDRPGLGAEMNPGTVVVDFGARSPRETGALLGVIGMRGVALVDAAIVGDAAGIANGAATVLTGGYPDAVDNVEAVLANLGCVDRTGPLGSAHTAAALMGYMEAAHCVAHAEAFSVGRALGLSGDTLNRVLDGGNDAATIVTLSKRVELARQLAVDRGITADVIDFTRARLGQCAGALASREFTAESR